MAQKTTFGTMAGLGAYRLDARTTTTTQSAGGDSVSDDAYSLRWRDAGHWQVVRRRAGRTLEEVRVWDNIAWRSASDGPLLLRGDAEPYRASLSLAWDPWAAAIGLWEDRVGFRQIATEEVEGRRALVYALEPLAGATARKSGELVGVEGKVWIDEATAARLVGDVKLTTARRGHERKVELRFSVTDIGGNPQVEVPPGVVALPPEPVEPPPDDDVPDLDQPDRETTGAPPEGTP